MPKDERSQADEATDAAWAVTHRLADELRARITDDETTRLLDQLSDSIGDLVVAAENAVLDHLVIGYRVPECDGVTLWKETAPTAYDPELDYEVSRYLLRVLGAPFEALQAQRGATSGRMVEP